MQPQPYFPTEKAAVDSLKKIMKEKGYKGQKKLLAVQTKYNAHPHYKNNEIFGIYIRPILYNTNFI